jgi:urease alpha subunit
MVVAVHNVSANIPEEITRAESRVRAETIDAEDALHNIEAISMMSSNPMALGRCVGVWRRTFQPANEM